MWIELEEVFRWGWLDARHSLARFDFKPHSDDFGQQDDVYPPPAQRGLFGGLERIYVGVGMILC